MISPAQVSISPTDSRRQTADSKTVDSRQKATDSKKQATGSRQQTGDNRQQTADSRQQTADSRQQTGDSVHEFPGLGLDQVAGFEFLALDLIVKDIPGGAMCYMVLYGATLFSLLYVMLGSVVDNSVTTV
jgi:hypothetical protein